MNSFSSNKKRNLEVVYEYYTGLGTASAQFTGRPTNFMESRSKLKNNGVRMKLVESNQKVLMLTS